MRLARRTVLVAAMACAWPRARGLEPRPLAFPRDHGAHLGQRIEWWYVTGALAAPDGALRAGFQITFFRVAHAVAATSASRWVPRHLLFAHAALTDLRARRLVHAERIARWSGDASAAPAAAATDDLRVHLGDWHLRRDATSAAATYATRFGSDDFALDLSLQSTGPALLQGAAGLSLKGPRPDDASFYVTEPQLAASGHLTQRGDRRPVSGRAWLDHEWSDSPLPAGAVGWDWVGMNLDDGAALTAFRLRRADGSALWAGGSWRERGQARARSFAAHEVAFTPQRHWTSPRSGARYPVEWALITPAGTHRVVALLDDQELDSRASTGAIYWEGLSELRASSGGRVGLGYLEMTGVAAPLRLG